jgi:hypothetical protein
VTESDEELQIDENTAKEIKGKVIKIITKEQR